MEPMDKVSIFICALLDINTESSSFIANRNLLSASISDIIEIFDLHEQIFIVKEAAAL
jgi:hypothetical protein